MRHQLSVATAGAIVSAMGVVGGSCARVASPAAEPVRSAEPAKPAATESPKVAASTPAPETVAEAPARSFHDFLPSRHGFQFRNGFQGSIFGTGESAFGLCGGMSFAAADYYLAGREIPEDVRAPSNGTPLFEYLWSRQSTSFGTLGTIGLKFVEWMQLADDGPDSAHARTLEGLPAIEKTLSRGGPVVLGLVLVKSSSGGKAWDNHQVLALEVMKSDELQTVLRIYDSNFPKRDDVTISVTRDPVAIAMHVPGRRDLPIRGFFRMAYSPVPPP